MTTKAIVNTGRALAVSCLVLAGCATEPTGRDECPVGYQEVAAAIGTAGYGAIGYNALTYNALTYNALTYNAISFNGLSDVDLDLSCGTAPLQLFEYAVTCALTPEQEATSYADGAAYTFNGMLGLAPGWADGPCDESCREWVSACLIARVNARGQHVEISLRGSHPALATSADEQAAFPYHEATYYGDLFAADGQVLEACLGDGVDHLERTCGDLEDCPIEITGRCSDLCTDAGCSDGRGGFYPAAIAVYRDQL